MDHGNVLFVINNPELRRDAARYFCNDPEIKVEVAATAREAFRALDAHAYRAIVASVDLPTVTGIELLRIVAYRYPLVTRILLAPSAPRRTAEITRTRAAAEILISTPISLERLRTVILDYLHERSTQAQPPKRTNGSAQPSTTPADGTAAAGKYLLDRAVYQMLQMTHELAPQISEHSYRVAKLSVETYDAMLPEANLTQEAWERHRAARARLYYAALLHDLGKVFIDSKIVNKGEPLRYDQRERVETQLSLIGQLLRSYLETAQNQTQAALQLRSLALVDEVLEILRAPPKRRNWSAAGEKLVELNSLTAELRYETGVTLLDDTITEALLTHDRSVLTASEFAELQSHPELSYRVTRTLPWPDSLNEVPFLCRHHHERINGSGYPDGLSETEHYPQELRVLNVVDSYDEMTAVVYNGTPRFRSESAIERLEHDAAGGKLDPRVLSCFTRVVRNGHQRANVVL